LDNIERTTRTYGVAHVTATLAQMKQVFAESLRHESTVCGGCFRALTLLSTELARQRGINVIITGLSRGQIFETKLKRLFEQGVFDPDEIDRRLDTHRQLFNTREDPIARAVGLNEVPGRGLDSIRYVDFFRYDPAPAGEVRRYLASRDERWVAPKDTGLCSTNCRINDVGIHVHQMEKGYHNYAAPLSWDVRFGITSRQEAREELGVHAGRDVHGILSEIGYTPRDLSQGVVQEAVVALREGPARQPVLSAYFVSSGRVNVAELRDYLAGLLPDYMVPKHLIRVDALPLNASGKVDLARLPAPTTETTAEPEPTASEIEVSLRRLWREVLGVEAIEVDDNFFDLGGDSLLATILVSLIEAELGKATSVVETFHHPTIRDMARLLRAWGGGPGEARARSNQGRRFGVISAKARTVIAAVFFALIGTAKKRKPDGGREARLARFSTIRISRRNSSVWAGRSGSLRSSALIVSTPTSLARPFTRRVITSRPI
jgi:acyl carrier protein